MDLVRDCLDKQLEDRNHRRMGRVDGIIIEVEPDKPPRVAFIQLGVKTMMNRLSPRLGNAAARVMKAIGISPEPYRIEWNKLHVGLNTVRADIDAEQTPAFKEELLLRKKIRRIPGATR